MTEDADVERILHGSAETVEELLRLFADEHGSTSGPLKITPFNNAEYPHTIDVRTAANNQIIGRIVLIDLPGSRVLFRFPQGRYQKWDGDPSGALLKDFIDRAMDRFAIYGLTARRSRFACAGMVDTAVRQLSAADTPEGFAAIGNVCRTALIALGREVFETEMSPAGDDPPNVDDAGERLRLTAKFHWGARSERQFRGIRKQIDGTWDICVSFLHRQNATREEAEIAVGSTAQLFDTFALLAP